MSLILIGIFIAVALVILGQKFPNLQPHRWLIVLPVVLGPFSFPW